MRTERVARGVAMLIGLAIIVIGARFLRVPDAAAASFGVAASASGDAGAYLATKGVRDIAFGLIVLVLLATSQTRALGWVLLVAALIPIGDATIVLTHGGPPAVAFGVHGMTALVILVTAVGLLRSGGQRQVFRRFDQSVLVPTTEHEQPGVLAH